MEACWAHNPEVRGSKPRSANLFFRFCSFLFFFLSSPNFFLHLVNINFCIIFYLESNFKVNYCVFLQDGLTTDELKRLDTFHKFFMNKYPVVGYMSGSEPTEDNKTFRVEL